MITTTGVLSSHNGHFVMHAPEFPYDSTVYIGYTLKQMQKKYRENNNLQGKKIKWIIVGVD